MRCDETFDDGGFAHTRFAGEDGVVLAAAHEDVHALADFLVAADDGINFALAGFFREVGGEAFQRLLLAHLGGRQSRRWFRRGRRRRSGPSRRWRAWRLRANRRRSCA